MTTTKLSSRSPLVHSYLPYLGLALVHLSDHPIVAMFYVWLAAIALVAIHAAKSAGQPTAGGHGN